MIILKKFLCCMSLHIGCTIIGYSLLLHGFGTFLLVLLDLRIFCGRMTMLWVMHCQFNIIAGVLLLAATADPNGLHYLLPIQIVVKLTSLIVELLFYLLLTSSNITDPSPHVIYSFISIVCTAYIVLVAISYYLELEDAF